MSRATLDPSGATLDLSLVLPCYNEASHLRGSVADLVAVLDESGYDYELVFVDDRSHDNTREIVVDICDQNDRARYIFHESNRGRGGAVKTGFESARGRVIGFLDVDLEVGPHYVPPLVRLIDDGFDIATGHRHFLLRQTGGWTRHLFSIMYQVLCRFLLNHGLKDTETGCKFFRRETTRTIVMGSENDGWFWDTEVMTRATLADLRIIEMPVLFIRRFDKESTVRLFRDSWGYVAGLWRFRDKVGLSMHDRSPIYWSARIYDFVMKSLTGSGGEAGLAAVADLIPRGSSVIDVCCGTASLYRHHLRGNVESYTGLDANGHFVMALRRQGVHARLHDVRVDPMGTADYVTMCSSLYHFYHDRGEILERLIHSARELVIISEPVRNLASSRFQVVRWAARMLSNPGVGNDHAHRFGLDELRTLADEHRAIGFHYEERNRNAVLTFRGNANRSDT